MSFTERDKSTKNNYSNCNLNSYNLFNPINTMLNVLLDRINYLTQKVDQLENNQNVEIKGDLTVNGKLYCKQQLYLYSTVNANDGSILINPGTQSSVFKTSNVKSEIIPTEDELITNEVKTDYFVSEINANVSMNEITKTNSFYSYKNVNTNFNDILIIGNSTYMLEPISIGGNSVLVYVQKN